MSGFNWIEKEHSEEFLEECMDNPTSITNIHMRRFLRWLEPRLEKAISSREKTIFEMRREGMNQPALCMDFMLYRGEMQSKNNDDDFQLFLFFNEKSTHCSYSSRFDQDEGCDNPNV